MTPSVINRMHPRVSRLSTWAIGGAACGLVSAIGARPPAAKAVLLVAFVFVGPGSAALEYWAATIPAVAQRALVPVLSFSIVLLVVTVALLLGVWSPRIVLLALAAVTAAVGLVNLRRPGLEAGAE